MNHPLWTQAENGRRREGRLADAEKAYFDLAALMNGTGGDHDIANLCYTRIHALREKKRTGGTTAVASATGLLQPPAPKDDGRGVRPGAPQALPPAANTNTGTSAGTANGDGPKWTGPGVLRRFPLTPLCWTAPANRPTRWKPRRALKAYVVGSPGVDLDKLVGKRVDVYGTAKTLNVKG